jgi:hypothetical protein
MQAQGVGNDYTQSLLNEYQSLLEMSGRMTP